MPVKVPTVESWRLLELIRVVTRNKEPLELADVEKLDRIAAGKADLHDVCKALENGCSIATATDIFT